MAQVNCDQACALAAFVLADAKQEMTAENITKVIQDAGIKVNAQWVKVFAEFLKVKNPLELLAQIGSGSSASAVVAAPATEAPAKEKTEEEQIVAGFAFGDSSSSEEESS
ncbi:Ribosomal_protein P1B [Hexamita inflata]|uniref:Ribosomal protein P1B n=1 Tax=Hexamita inflata TaxID=28002 RepID=A0AA86QZ55_9EUKA|nr:Ribosomal protein P1B [Hexamita inflata]CAI9951199.1 Ribosomal protein P1B [Hexamita inflata]CAI9957850.1 Ribosomal protein P1B [Hexamita inflata]CAI9962598.1 Ribosomal protein P1B [Hexamita inflata]